MLIQSLRQRNRRGKVYDGDVCYCSDPDLVDKYGYYAVKIDKKTGYQVVDKGAFLILDRESGLYHYH